MYYDIELSHTLFGDGAPCECTDGHGGRDCKMESSTIKQVVEWLEEFGDKCPKDLNHVQMSS
jgi:hypothetical protein